MISGEDGDRQLRSGPSWPRGVGVGGARPGGICSFNAIFET